MARSARHLTSIVALLEERGIDLLVLKQGIDTTTTPAARFPSASWARGTRCSPTSSPKAPAKAWNPPGPGAGSAGRKPKLRARQSEGGSRHV